jgi:2-polyprenyl-3-methyl-5-hydroxy-6-metoxy-1,4-benzoquinol methylase
LYDSWPFKQKFDVIVAGEILEHLYHPEKFIKKCHYFLKSGGILLVSVPNAYIISNRIRFVLGKEVTAHYDPTHINLFSEKKLKQLLKKYFKKVKIDGIAPPAYKLFLFLSNSLFADDLLVKAIK